MIKLKYNPFNTKCGCPDCEMGIIPHDRGQWKGRSNKDGKIFGAHRKGTHSKQGFR